MAAVRVGVIGAGPSGLVALKELRAAGLDAVAFEAQSELGGLFVFRESDGLVWDTLHLTSSALVTQFSDFPPARPTAFWRHDEYVAYLRAYAGHFGLLPHIRLDAPVASAVRHGHGWLLSVAGEAPEQVDALVVCSGIHREAHVPDIPGLDTFTGDIVTSSAFRRAAPFRGRRVVCVGGGESGGDIAPLISEVAASCTVSLRRGANFQPRFVNGSPGDYLMTRLRHGVGHESLALARRVARERASGDAAHQDVDHFQFEPEVGRVVRAAIGATGLARWQQFATKTAAVPEAVARGRLSLKPGIASVAGSRIRFVDGSEDDADVLVFCTGFKPPSWPFLGALAPARGLYRRVFDPELRDSAAFVGFARPAIGSIPVIAEMQARWVGLVLSGQRRLPPPDAMHAAIAEDEASIARMFPKDVEQLPYLVAHAQYLDALARDIGCLPTVQQLRSTPGLLRAFYEAPFTAVQYRLVGPGALPDAAARLLELPCRRPDRPSAGGSAGRAHQRGCDEGSGERCT